MPNNDVDKILQNLKNKKPEAAPKPTISADRLSEIIARETGGRAAPANPVQSPVHTAAVTGSGTADIEQSVIKAAFVETAKDPAENSITVNTATVTAGSKQSENTAAPIENEFFSRLAGALKENPVVGDLVEDVPEEFDEKSKDVHVTAATYVDDKFVKFFTESVSVPKVEPKQEIQPDTGEIKIKRKRFGLFRNKYITDSLSLSISQEEIDRRQQKTVSAIADTVRAIEEDREVKQSVQQTFVRTEKAPKADSAETVFKSESNAAPQPSAVKPADPNDADSILAAIKKRHEVTVSNSAAMSGKNTVSAESNAAPSVKGDTVEFNGAVSGGDVFATAYIPTADENADTREIGVQPSDSAPADGMTGYIPKVKNEKEYRKPSKSTVDNITQMFAAAGVVKGHTEKDSTGEINIHDTEAEDEEIFEGFSGEDEYILSQFSDDPGEIFEELKSFKITLSIRVGLAAICSLVLLYLNLGATMGMPLPDFISPIAQPVMFYLATLIFFVIVIVGFLPTIANGVSGIAGAPTKDSFLVMPTVLAFAQINLAIFNYDSISPENTTIFAGFVALAFGFNALGKYINANTILRNLDLAEVPEGINAGYIVKDLDDVKRLARSLEEKKPQILVSRKTGYISNFISGGFSLHPGERQAKLLSVASAAVSLVCAVTAFITTKDMTKAVFAAAGASVLMLPLAHSLISSVPSALMQKALNQVGALVNGWQGIYQLCDASHVSFDAKHLFPKGCVVLHGIKTFEKERLDLAILYAATIAIEKCDNLRSVFMTVIDGKKDMLYKLESCEYKVGQGYVAWIEGNRIIMGNRSVMEEYDIAMPPQSLENQYASGNKKPIYLSVNGKLFGMFVVSYHADSAVKDNLLHLIEQGKNVILQSSDFSIDSDLLEYVYDLPKDTVQVLNKNETALLLGYTAYSESTDSAMAHLDSLHSLSAGFFGADSAKRAAATCNLVQIIGIVVGAVLSVMFTVSQTIWELPIASIILLGLGWLGLCLMRAIATKYL